MYLYKYIVFLYCIFFSCFLPAQRKVTVDILHADSFEPGTTSNLTKFLGNVRIKHNRMFMSCDSLYRYSDSSFIKAFGHVHAVQDDTLHLWGDFLVYDTEKEFAMVRNNVILKDNRITLKTNFLDYDVGREIGNYYNGGVIEDETNTLRSRVGYYYKEAELLFFKDSVDVVTPDYHMVSDTMKYHTFTKIISILGPTTVYGEERTLYSEDGWYSTLVSHGELYKNNRISYNQYICRADTIVVDSLSGTAFLKKNIVLRDTVDRMVTRGHIGEVLKWRNYAYVTDSALLIIGGERDSLYIHGDTLAVTKDTMGLDVVRAFYNTKFYSIDLQGKCDSMSFYTGDSIVRLYESPIVWTEDNQMTAEKISMKLRRNEVDKFFLEEDAMLVNRRDSNMYNQIKGKKMTGYFDKNQLYMIFVDGSGETLYYPDEGGEIIGLNRASSPKIRINIEENKIASLTFIGKTEGSLKPIFMVDPQERELRGFSWHISLRPRSVADIFKKEEIEEGKKSRSFK